MKLELSEEKANELCSLFRDPNDAIKITFERGGKRVEINMMFKGMSITILRQGESMLGDVPVMHIHQPHRTLVASIDLFEIDSVKEG